MRSVKRGFGALILGLSFGIAVGAGAETPTTARWQGPFTNNHRACFINTGSGLVLQDSTVGPCLPELYAGDYGVVCDGARDNTAAMQAVIDVANNGSAAFPGLGPTVIVPSGFCDFAGKVTIRKGMILRGQGAGGQGGAGNSGGTAWRNTATTDDIIAAVSDGAVIIQDMTIFSSTRRSVGAGISLSGASGANPRSQISRVRILNMADGIRIDNATAWRIENSVISDFTHDGVLLANGSSPDGGDSSIVSTLIWDQNVGTSNACFEYQQGGTLAIVALKCLNSDHGFLMNLQGGPTGTVAITGGSSFELQKVASVALTQGVAGTDFANFTIATDTEFSTASPDFNPTHGSVWVKAGTAAGGTPSWIHNINISGVFNNSWTTSVPMIDVEDGDGVLIHDAILRGLGTSGLTGVSVSGNTIAAHATVRDVIGVELPSGIYGTMKTGVALVNTVGGGMAIGKPVPNSLTLLDINSGGFGKSLGFSAGNTLDAQVGTNVLFASAGAEDLQFRAEACHSMIWGFAGSERMRLLCSGFLGIGTTTPTGPLDVEGGSSAVTDTAGVPITLVAQGGGPGNASGGDITLTAGAKTGSGTQGRVRITLSETPTSAAAACTAGQINWDSGFVYICIATDTWKRVAIATWP